MLFAAVSRPIAAGDGCEVRLMATLSGRGCFAGIARFSSMIEGAQETDQQHHKVDFDGHSLSTRVRSVVRLTLGEQETFQRLNSRNLSRALRRSMCRHDR